jgi:hypothetical protein
MQESTAYLTSTNKEKNPKQRTSWLKLKKEHNKEVETKNGK